MVSGPECLLILDDVEDVGPALAYPSVHIFLCDIGDHVGKAARTASPAGNGFRTVHFQGISYHCSMCKQDVKELVLGFKFEVLSRKCVTFRFFFFIKPNTSNFKLILDRSADQFTLYMFPPFLYRMNGYSFLKANSMRRFRIRR